MQMLVLVSALAFILGLAIQRGTTCAVLAIEELIEHRRADRFLGFFECGMWAALMLFLLGRPADGGTYWSFGWSLFVGAALFGAGAAINGACAFGTIGRLGNGRFEYTLTIAAAWVAMQGVSALGWAPASGDAPASEDRMTGLSALALVICVMAIRWCVRRRKLRSFLKIAVTMAVIGAVGAALGALHRPWPWMNSVMAAPELSIATFCSLFFLVSGAVIGGILGGQFRIRKPSSAEVMKRLGGGAMMGAGVLLVPGGNDALILYGVPQGDLRAITAYLTVLASISLTLVAIGGVSPRWRRPTS